MFKGANFIRLRIGFSENCTSGYVHEGPPVFTRNCELFNFTKMRYFSRVLLDHVRHSML